MNFQNNVSHAFSSRLPISYAIPLRKSGSRYYLQRVRALPFSDSRVMLNLKSILQRYNLARCALLRFVSPIILLTNRRQQRLVSRQCNCTIDNYPDLERDERHDILRADVFRRFRVPDRREVRLRVPLEHFGRDQPLPERRRERDERGGWARRDDECENLNDHRFWIIEKLIVRVFPSYSILCANHFCHSFVSSGRARLHALPSLFPTFVVLVSMLSAALFFP